MTIRVRLYAATILAACVSVLSASAAAQETRAPGIDFELGAGANFQARYEGSDSYGVGPWPIFRLKGLTFANGFSIGGGDGTGLSLKPSFRYIGSRKSADFPELTGLNDVDAAFELGIGARYATEQWRVFADLRAGLGGHNGIVGEIGADAIVRPLPELAVWAGPRLSFANAEYMNTYFGVTAAESLSSGLAGFDAGGGIKSAGAEIGMRYDFNKLWALEGSASYAKLIGDAGDSPITALGDADQYGFKLGLVRSFRVDF
jgi:outer membrane protein